MNASIQAIIDHMFRDTVDNAETRALHEELLNNCLEHYDDLIGRGMTEIEAIDAVVDSLKGMKEVIDEYPKKPGTGMEEIQAEPRINNIPGEETERPETTEPVQEKPSEYSYSSVSVKKLRTDLKSCDLKIGRSPDGKIHVRCEDMDQLRCELNGSTLSVCVVDKARKSIEEAEAKMNGTDFSLKSLLSFIGKTIGTAASYISVSWDVYVDLPDVVLSEMELNSKSGEIEVESCIPDRLNIRTMSGDVEVKAADNHRASRVSISTMSGDIEFRGDADSLTLTTMSGDAEAYGTYMEAEIKSTSGDADLTGEAERIRMHSVSGDVTAELKNDGVRLIDARSTSGDVEIGLAKGTDSVHVNASTVSGTVSKYIPDCGAGAQLQINAGSVSGDVTIR